MNTDKDRMIFRYFKIYDCETRQHQIAQRRVRQVNIRMRRSIFGRTKGAQA